MNIDSEKLLYLIEAKSPIYNFKDKDYSNRIEIEKCWEEIANKMNCSVSECKSKWTSLRNSYTRYLREERAKPSRSIGKKKKKWYLADAMSFLKDYINQHQSMDSSLDEANAEELMEERVLIDCPPLLNECTKSALDTPENTHVPAKRSRTLPEMVAGPMIKFLNARSKERAPENGNALFFKSLLADYEKLTSKRQRLFRMHMISKMNELQEEEENDGAFIADYK